MKEIKADSEKWKGRENQIRGEDSAFKRIDNLKKGENDENSKTLILLLKSGAIFQLRFQQSLGTNRKNWLWQKEISLSAPLWVEQPAVDRAGSASNSRRPSSQDLSSCFSFHLSSPLHSTSPSASFKPPLCACLASCMASCLDFFSFFSWPQSPHIPSPSLWEGAFRGHAWLSLLSHRLASFFQSPKKVDRLRPADCGRLRFGPEVLKMQLWLLN